MKIATALAISAFLAAAVSGCSGKFLKVDNPDVLKPDEEFERTVKIVSAPEPVQEPAKVEEPKKAPKKKAAAVPTPKTKNGKSPVVVDPNKHEPADVEDGTGFVGRRPIKDPFWVGEKVVHDVSYFGVSAGSLVFKIDPMVEVNGKRAYQFITQVQTYPTFSRMVYAADDTAITHVDYEQLIPRVFTLHVKESTQLREARSFFDFDKMQARYWDKRVTEKDGVEEKKLEWEILPYSQNVFSALFYMRVFAWEVGKEYAFRVADDKENKIFKGKALRKEILNTDLGKMKAIVIKPEIYTKGTFAPVGDILIWLSDDDRKLVLRIESKIKIGTLVTEIVQLDPGKAP